MAVVHTGISASDNIGPTGWRIKPPSGTPNDYSSNYSGFERGPERKRTRKSRAGGVSSSIVRMACLLAPPHAVIEIEDVHLDLVSGVVTREMRHLQHVNDAAWISVAPFDQLTQDMIEV